MNEPPRRAREAGGRSSRMLLWTLAIAIGVLAGVGGYTFRYAEGLSYLSTDPKACVNCHIMQPQFDGWQKASHHTVAVCVDCHLPHQFFGKYLAKAENGYRHSKAFTMQDFEEPITVKERGRAILQENCVTCHEAMIHRLSPGAPSGPTGIECVHCHAEVGHGPRAGMGGAMRPEEIVSSPESRKGLEERR